MTDITEFTLMDTDELHLVAAPPANGFPHLMLKDLTESEAVALATQRAGERINAILTKATVSTASQNDLPDSDFAYIEDGGTKDSSGKTTPRSKRHFPIMDAAHVRNALARASQSPFGDKAMPKIKAAAKKFGIEMSKALVAEAINALTDAKTQIDELAKAIDPTVRPTPNSPDTAEGDPTVPGSPAWEALDAARLIAAGQVITTALSIVNAACQREQMEVATGHADDTQDVWDLQTAEDALNCALSIVARISFTEEHEGQMTDVAKGLVEMCEHKIRAALLGDSNQPDSRAAVSKTTSEEVLTMELTEQELTERITKASEEAATTATTKLMNDLAELKKAEDDKAAEEAELVKAADAKLAKEKAEADEVERLAKEKLDAEAAAAGKTPEELAKEKADAEVASDPIAKAVAAGIEAGLAKAGELFKSEVQPLREDFATYLGQPRQSSIRFTTPRGGEINMDNVLTTIETRLAKSTDRNEVEHLNLVKSKMKLAVAMGTDPEEAMRTAAQAL